GTDRGQPGRGESRSGAALAAFAVTSGGAEDRLVDLKTDRTAGAPAGQRKVDFGRGRKFIVVHGRRLSAPGIHAKQAAVGSFNREVDNLPRFNYVQPHG